MYDKLIESVILNIYTISVPQTRRLDMIDEKALDNYVCEGQMSFSDLYPEPVSPLVAVSKAFASARKEMSLPEWRAFIYLLTTIKWKESNNNVFMLDKKQLASIVGVASDPDHLSQDLKRSIGKLPKHSFIEIDDQYRDVYASGNIVRSVRMYQNRVCIKLDEDYMPMFQNLTKDFITMWAEDLFRMKSERAILFYEDLRMHSDTRKVNEKIYSIPELKKMFDIPKEGRGSYMKKDGHFDRPHFEQRVLIPLVEEIKQSRMINLHVNPDGLSWEKVKDGKFVVGYRFVWSISTHPGAATAEEVEELNQDPVTLTVAKKLKDRPAAFKDKKTASKSGKSKPANAWGGFEQHQYSDAFFEALESGNYENLDM